MRKFTPEERALRIKKADRLRAERLAMRQALPLLRGLAIPLVRTLNLAAEGRCQVYPLTLMKIANAAIAALDAHPDAKYLAEKHSAWPELVPGGGIEGPLFKDWLARFEAKAVGSKNLVIPKSGTFDQKMRLAFRIYAELEQARNLRELMQHEETMAAARHAVRIAAGEAPPNSKARQYAAWMRAAWDLDDLAVATAKAWRDAALKWMWEGSAKKGGWRAWVEDGGPLSDLKKRADEFYSRKEEHEEEYRRESSRQNTAKSAISEALLAAFELLAKRR